MLEKIFGCVRFLWNKKVAAFNQQDHGPNFSNATIKQLKVTYTFLSEVPYDSLDQKARDFEEFKSQYFSKTRKKVINRPKFKSKGKSNDSFRLSVNGFKIKNGEIHIAKLGKLNVVFDRRWKGIPKSITVSRNRSGQYFVSVLVPEEMKLKQRTGRSIGIDLGLTDLCTFSDGTKISNPKWFREIQSELARQQRHLSRKQKGSIRYEKQRIKVAKLYQKVTNQRNFIHHNLSTWLVENYDIICMEDLNIAGMKSLFGKSVSDAAWSSLVQMIQYKCDWYGKTFQQVDRWYASSKLCNHCGHKFKELGLKDRGWTCKQCGTHHDRDINAADNILKKGILDLYGFTSEEYSDYKRREELRPSEVSLPKASSVKRLFSK